MPVEPTPAPAEPAPASLRTALLLLAGEALLFALVTAYLVIATVAGAGAGVGTAIAVDVFAALVTGLLAWFTWALFRRRDWARGPAVTLNLLLVPIGATTAGAGLPLAGIAMLVIGLVGAGSLLAPATRAALDRN